MDFGHGAWLDAALALDREPIPPPAEWHTHCHRCGSPYAPGTFTITFLYAPEETKTQPVKGYICGKGHTFAIQKLAALAHWRAFGSRPWTAEDEAGARFGQLNREAP